MNMDIVNHKIVKNRIGLLKLAEELGDISKACRIMGFSRDTFYRYKAAKEEGGIEALFDANRRKPNLLNRVDPITEEAVVEHAISYPAEGQTRASNELRKKGICISPSGIRSIWLRHNLEKFSKRLKALEEKSAKEGSVLTEAQVQALERKKLDDVASGEIDTAHPGYLGSQDTFYVGTLKGVGRVYQQTFVDTYSKVAFAKLYTNKTPITSADLLNDKVLPFFEDHKIPLLRILTDRGTEYCGKHDAHDYQLYLGLNDIEHTKTKVKSPQTNGICERFHKTILREFYQVAFRKKIYRRVEEMQEDLDLWIEYYNLQRTHQGKMCCGRTPMQTFLDTKCIVQQKFYDLNLAD
jgi:transposase InsO family protein